MQELLSSLEKLSIRPKEEHEEILSVCIESKEVKAALEDGNGEQLTKLKKLENEIRFVGIHPADDDEEQEDEQEQTPNESKIA